MMLNILRINEHMIEFAVLAGTLTFQIFICIISLYSEPFYLL